MELALIAIKKRRRGKSDDETGRDGDLAGWRSRGDSVTVRLTKNNDFLHSNWSFGGTRGG